MTSQGRTAPVRPGYSVRVSEGRQFVVPTILDTDNTVALAVVNAPDLTNALEMPGGVSNIPILAVHCLMVGI